MPFGSVIPAVAAALSLASTAQEPAPAPQSKNYFNPQLAIVFDFRGRFADPDTAERKVDFSEIEFGFASDVDPFLRAEAYIAVTKEDGETVLEVEEAFGRYVRLGRGTEAKVGKLAGAIGRVQRNHADQQEFLDFPFVIQDMLGEEGLRAPGASVSYLFPGDQFNEVTLEALVPLEDGPLFAGSDMGKPVFIGRYRTFFDFNQDLSAQLGASAATGPNGSDRGTIAGLDFVAKWQPGTKGRSAILETEAYWGDPGTPASDTAFGAFASLSYEVMPRWFANAKVDYSEMPGTTDLRRGMSLGITHKVTEFHHWRLEWQRITSNFEPDKDVLNLQFQFLIGAHPAHKY